MTTTTCEAVLRSKSYAHPCTLPGGHGGSHRSASGFYWTNATTRPQGVRGWRLVAASSTGAAIVLGLSTLLLLIPAMAGLAAWSLLAVLAGLTVAAVLLMGVSLTIFYVREKR